MKLSKIISWLNAVLRPNEFDDVSNNGLQIARQGEDISRVAFGVDGSLAFLTQAADWGAELAIVHHGISWGGGIRRLTEGPYAVVQKAITSNLALFASHLPLDANKRCGNNWEIARALKLTAVKCAFNYHGNIIGLVGRGRLNAIQKLFPQAVYSQALDAKKVLTIGVCSGGAGEFATDAKRLGCDVYLTGEANWGDQIAAENVSMPLVTAGHYETEVFGVQALAREMAHDLKIETKFFGR